LSWGGGIGLGYLRHSADAETRPLDIKILARLLAYGRPYRRLLWTALAAALGGSAMTVGGPYLLKLGIDQGIVAGRPGVVLGTAGLYLATRVVSTLLGAVQTLAVSRLGNEVVHALRRELFSKLMVLGLDFFDAQPVGVIVSRGTNDVGALSNLVSSGIVSITTDAVTLLGIMGIMLWISPLLALAAFTTLPMLAGVTALFQGRAVRAFREVRTTIARVTADLEENLSGIRVAQAFAREEANARLFGETNRANLEANMDAAAVNSLFAPTVGLVGTLGTVIVLWFGGWLVLRGTVTVGVLVAFLNYLSRFFQPIQDLTQQYNLVQQAMAAAEKLFSVLDEPLQVRDAPDAAEMPPIRGHVRFRQISFGYRPGQPVLHDVDFELSPGCRAALVGPTGAGKSTIAALLLRFYDPAQGAVEVDGIDLRTVTQASYRRQVAVVLQDPVIFSATVADNIRYGNLEASLAEVEAAARAVGADEFIRRLPHGYDTPVGERGARLSQGQKQLISFARALLADPRILVLDEATANIDSMSERLIQEALGRLLAGRTALVIAHRLSTVRDADLILVVEGGRIVERGRHEELLALGGLYAGLYRRQLGLVAAG
jgi:ATP-binding cassette subfamily B multidrug efflux pump